MKSKLAFLFILVSLGTLQAQDITTPYYIHNQGETGYMTQLSDVATKYTLRLRSHAANGTSFYFGQGNLGATQLLQSANSTGATAYTLSLNPFGGKVGVGTANPSSKFDVIGQDVTFFSIATENTFYMGRNQYEHFEMKMGDHHGHLDLIQDVDGNSSHIFYIRNRALGTSPDNDIRFQTASKDRMTIKTNGNIGIGTHIPSEKLEINGGTITTMVLGTGMNQANSQTGIDFKHRYGPTFSNGEILSFIRSLRFGADGKGSLVFGTSGTLGVHAIERMRIDQNGNVGIGTTLPQRKLSIIDGTNNAKLRLGYDDDFYMDYGNNSISMNRISNSQGVLTIETQGSYASSGGHIVLNPVSGRNVGIGVNPDHAKLEIKQTANLEALRIDGASGAFALVVQGGTTNTTHLRSGLTIGQNYFVAPPSDGMIVQGNVGIGTTNPGTYKLAVEGKIGARSVKVTTASWADYVFAPTYHLMSLPETEAYIQENQHLPNIPSAAEVKQNGFHLEEMDAKLLAKIEELTLYAIAQEKEIKTLKEEKERSRILLESMEARLQRIEAKAK